MSEQRQIRLRGDGVNVNRYRVRREGKQETSLYVDVQGEHTVAELVAFLLDHAEMRPDMGNVVFRGGCFISTIPATPEDVARWEQSDAAQAERALASRRAHYERLRAEFEGADR